MTTADYDFNQTRNQIIERAFRIVGAIDPDGSMSSVQYTQGTNALNSMVKSWQNDHVFLWTVRDVTQALSSGTGSYAAPTDPALLDIDRAWLRIDGNDTEIDVKTYREYQDIYDKDAPGDPTLVALDGRISGTIYTWPVVSTTGRTLFLSGIVKLKDFDTAAGNPDFPERWLDALTYGLAGRLVDEYPLPIGEKQYIKGVAELEYRKAKKGDKHRGALEFMGGCYK